MNAISTLKDEYKEDCSLNEALVLAAKVLGKSMDMASPDANKFEMGVLTRDGSGRVIQRLVEGDELQKILTDAKIFEQKSEKK